MWQLITKNRFGQVDHIQKEGIFTKQPVYDNISPKGNGYNKANLTVEYTVEWLPERNYEAFEKAQLAGSEVNPWELKDEYLTDSLGLAIRMLLIRQLDDKAEKPTLYMYIKDQNGNDAEATTEIPGDTVPMLRNMVQENINKKLSSYENQISALETELETYKKFIKKMHGEKLFDEFRREMMK